VVDEVFFFFLHHVVVYDVHVVDDGLRIGGVAKVDVDPGFGGRKAGGLCEEFFQGGNFGSYGVEEIFDVLLIGRFGNLEFQEFLVVS